MHILFEGPANLFRGIEGVGGQLLLSTDCLLFKPHLINIQKEEEIIYLGDIKHVEKTNTLGVIPNGLKVTTAHKEYRFVVKKRSQWIAKINDQVKRI